MPGTQTAAASARASRLPHGLQHTVTVACTALLLTSALGAPLTAHAQDDALSQSSGEPMELAAISYLGNAELPPVVGQANFAVYLPETGHTLSDVFLDYWRATGEEAMFGFPISEPFATNDGTYTQV